MLMFRVIVLNIFLTAAEARLSRDRKGPVSPTLHPASDNKFFGHDYPADHRGGVTPAFSHPYPIMQDSEDYSVDYVKDENQDGGEWDAQQDYDELRALFAKQRAEAEQLLQQERDAQHALDSARSSTMRAKEAAAKALDETLHAQAASEALKHKMGSHNSAVDSAVEDVERQTRELEECQKELERARDRLAIEQREQDKAEALERDAEATMVAAKKERVEKLKEQKQYHDMISKEQGEHADAVKAYQVEATALKMAEVELKQAEDHLRRVRHDSVTPGGGIYYISPPVAPSAPVRAPPPPPSPPVAAPAPVPATTKPPPPVKSGIISCRFGLPSVIFVVVTSMFRSSGFAF